ncbi:hypothetical protein [Paenibacillus sp. KS-LC4]|uniref:hypothetical protein n=1 Tax=Paenibacillus sp. KS-LC4 TaxID=2979727 RepID=UPI0030CAB498
MVSANPASITPVNATKKQSLFDLIKVIYSPAEVLGAIQPTYRMKGIIFVFFILYYAFNYFVSNKLLMTEEVQKTLGESGLEMPASVMQLMQIITTFFSTIIAFVILLVTFVLLRISGKLFKLSFTKKQLFLVLLYAQVPILIGKGLKLAFVNWTDLSLSTPVSTGTITNLGLLANQITTNGFLINLLSSIDLLELWSYILIGLGISFIGHTTIKKGMLSSFSIWGVLFVINVIVVLI